MERTADIAKKLKRAFKKLDTNSSGFVSEDLVKQVFLEAAKIPESDSVALLANAEHSEAGLVNYNKFLDWLLGSHGEDVLDRIAYAQAPLVLPDNMGELDMTSQALDSVTRKCKIICTMGPSCWDVDKLVELIDAGMNICRLNFSHGDHEAHGACVKRIREAAAQRPDKPIAILLDTKGPEIRTGFFASGDKIHLTAGQELKLVIDYSFKGDNTCIAVTYEKLPTAVAPGNQILIADGSLVLKVKSCGEDHVITEVMNDCSIGERKNCNLPGVHVDLPVLQDKDKNDLVNFGIPQDVDFVAASFVQSAADVRLIRETLGEAGKNIKIISKIENQAGLANFDEILEATDGVMVARGDLGMEIPPEKVFLAQKVMIAKCNLAGKPVVTATQMLESMTKAPRPTRAEAGDVANAVLDGTDCVMLSGETAGGSFPVEAVTIMRQIVTEAEATLDYNAVFLRTRLGVLAENMVMSEAEAACSSVVKNSHDVGSPCIIVLSKSGAAARTISKYRPQAPIFMVSTNEKAVRHSACMRGVVPVQAKTGLTTDERLMNAIEHAKQLGLAKSGDIVTAIHGKDGSTNLIKMVAVDGVDNSWSEVEIPKKALRNYGQASLFLPRSMGDFDLLEYTSDSFSRKCKIICTMGPSCWSVENLVKLIDGGMNVARLNFSHGDHEAHGACVQRIREADKLRPNKPVAILLDTKGPEIRTGFFAAGGKIDLKAGQDLKLVVDYSFKGDNTCFAVTYEKLPTAVQPGNQILIADGSLVLKVKSCGDDHVITEVQNDCSIGERKNCNLPGVKVDLPVLQDKDKDDLINFAIPQGVHFVAASFVQCAADVQLIRDTLGEAGKHIKIISKIENQEGLQNFDEICEASDAIMIARGDLGMEVPPEKVFLAQKIMTAKCNAMGKPVVTATQMLESMCKAPRPTRAEAGDVANAVLDGTDCVMLSGETAGGSFPVEAVTTMRRVVEEAEKNLDYLGTYLAMRSTTLSKTGRMSSLESFASTAVKTASDMGSPLILIFAGDGSTVRLVAKYRPRATILAVTNSEIIQRQLLTSRGVISMLDTSYDGNRGVGADVDAFAARAIAYAKEIGVAGVTSGAPVVMLSEESSLGANSRITKIVPVQ
eukprot:TRINITY_DN1773_c0_g2_i1.p1 TRINITY_DN1773_c0_g2~~TRINITY_DN1773_c0_g2_i1.p1  ORF type:complete len:1116 (+),score=189.59 TRINITY_DN1773_c0_g2_i1:284-3631(+)